MTIIFPEKNKKTKKRYNVHVNCDIVNPKILKLLLFFIKVCLYFVLNLVLVYDFDKYVTMICISDKYWKFL